MSTNPKEPLLKIPFDVWPINNTPSERRLTHKTADKDIDLWSLLYWEMKMMMMHIEWPKGWYRASCVKPIPDKDQRYVTCGYDIALNHTIPFCARQ